MRLAEHRILDLETALVEAKGGSPFPAATDRDTWGKVADRLGVAEVRARTAAAEEVAGLAPPSLPASLWLEFDRSGRREGYQGPMGERRRRLALLTLAECLEGRGRFLDGVMNLVWAICEESTWVMPAHQGVLADVTRPGIDLGAASTALDLAEVDSLLGPLLPPEVARRVRHEVEVRCIGPALARHDFRWWYPAEQTAANWTAVCCAGVAGAALYLEPDPGRLAELLGRLLRPLDDYLMTFGRDGGSDEGPGYWSYGFGHYALLGHLIEHRTGGRVRLLDGGRVAAIARFPLRTLLGHNRWPNFSDCPPDVTFSRSLLAFLSRRLDIPDLMRLARDQPAPAPSERSMTWALRDLFWRVDAEPAGPLALPEEDWLEDLGWLIARTDPSDPNALALAVKAGDNGEDHNHNDVGSLIVQVGGEQLVAELGSGRYTKEYFRDGRYGHLAARSGGHSVPVPNGFEQLPGPEHAAERVERRGHGLAMRLEKAYPPEAGLEALERSVTLERQGELPVVELVDRAVFSGGEGVLGTRLVTFGRVDEGPGGCTIRGADRALRVDYDPAEIDVEVEEHRDADLAGGPRDVRLLLFTARPGREPRLRLRLSPGTPAATTEAGTARAQPGHR